MTLTFDDLHRPRADARHVPGRAVMLVALAAAAATWASARSDADVAASRAARRLALVIEVVDTAPPAARGAVLAAATPRAVDAGPRPDVGSAEAWRDAERVVQHLRAEVRRGHRIGLASVVGPGAAVEPRLQVGLSDGSVLGIDLGPAALGRWTGRQ